MKRTRQALGLEAGFTLVEMMASVVVFAVMTIGIAPLIGASMRGAGTSRAFTVGKNFAVQTMERVRSLPFYVSYATQNQKVDVLDLYFPNDDTPGYNATDSVYTTTCSTPAPSDPACPRNAPTGYSVTFKMRFVAPNAGGGLTALAPNAGYQWDSLTLDRPRFQLAEMTLTTSWVFGGETRTYTLRSLIGDRKIQGDRVRGTAKIDYGIQVVTNFEDDTGGESQLTVTGGTAESRIESRLLSSADQFVRAARLQLAQLTTGTTVAAELGLVDGATSDVHAPEDSNPPGASAGSQTITHDDLLFDIAGIDGTTTSNLEVDIADELPTATGDFDFNVDAGESAGLETDTLSDLWVMNQADTGESAALRLDPVSRLLALRARTGPVTLNGSSSAIATSIATPSTREVETVASVGFGRMKLFTALLPTATTVVRIRDFTATVTCTATPTGTAGATAVWSATLEYFADSDPTNDIASGSHVSRTLGSAQTADPLAGLGPESEGKTNPLVYDGVTAASDIYLFDDAANSKNGYLSTWNSAFGQDASVLDGGQVTKAAISSAVFISTAPTNETLPNSGLKVSIGKLSCDALDKR